MARDVAVRPAQHPALVPWSVRPPAGQPPDRWDLVTDGAAAIWWDWLRIAGGSSPAELDACWYRIDDLGMGLGLYVPRRLGSDDAEVDDEFLNVVRLVDLDGWSRGKTGSRLYPDLAEPKEAARRHLRAGRVQLASAGVLPWAAWPAGKLPRTWWADPQTHAALGAWRAAAEIARDEGGLLRRIAQETVARAVGAIEATLGAESTRTQRLAADARRVVAVARAAPHATVDGAWAALSGRRAA